MLYVTRLRNQYDTSPKPYPLDVIVKEMRSGKTTLHHLHDAAKARTIAEATTYALELRKQFGEEPYDVIKKAMPQLMPAIVTDSRTMDTDTQFSELVCLEYDEPELDTGAAFMLLTQHPNVVFAWRSLSNKPKALIRVDTESLDGQPLNANTFQYAWTAATLNFQEIGEADVSAIRPTQTQNLCHDPQAYFNPDAPPLEWDIDEQAMQEVAGNATTVWSGNTPSNYKNLSELDARYLDAIAEMEFVYGKSKQNLPCPFEFHENDDWTPGHKRNGTRVWKSSNGDIAMKCYKCNEFQRFRNIPPVDEILNAEAEAVERAIANAPEPDRYGYAYNHFTTEHKQLLRADGYNPMAEYHEVKRRLIPAWTPKYENLNPLLGGCDFAMNGQPAETEKHRVWFTQLQQCDTCGNKTSVYWIDRFRHISGHYCDACHKDNDAQNSLLRLELQRPLTNHYVSTDMGYVSDDPYWNTTPLWERGRLTFLAAAMNTGKTTYSNAEGVARAKANKGDFILCVPRISLAIEQWEKLTAQHGHGSFGLFHEGSRKSVGRLGAVCCLSSLSNVFGYEDYHTGDTYDLQNAWIFIDEMDYAYQLLNLLSPVARDTKQTLETALHTNGLVVAGQTEWTAAIETLATELETDTTLGYYKNLTSHGTPTEIVVYPDVEGKNAWALSEMMDYIREILDAGLHAYCFCATRRDVAVLRQEFIELSPLTFTSLSKNTERAKTFLANGKLTDTPLFLATSAAAVGISIHDPKARTAILAGLVHGRLNCADIVQERVRDRGQNAGRIFLPTYENAFPVTQTDATKVSRYEAEKKRIATELADADLKNADKLAATYALNSLAEDDPVTFITHHLQNIAGFTVKSITPDRPCEIATQHVKGLTKASLEDERAATEKIALDVIDAEINRLDATDYQPPALKTTSEVRKLAALDTVVLGNKKATDAAILIGFDDKTDIGRGSRQKPASFDWRPGDLDITKKVIRAGVDPHAWTQKFMGYLAARHPYHSNTQWEIAQESGSELSAIKDYHFIGQLVAEIVDTLAGEHWETETLITELQIVLDTETATGFSYLTEIQRGVIGVKLWRKARYLNVSKTPVQFCLELITDFYPCQFKQHKGVFSIHDEQHFNLFNDALNAYLYYQGVTDDTDIGFTEYKTGLIVRSLPELHTPKQALYNDVKQLFADDVPIDEIKERTGVSERKIYELTKAERTQKGSDADRELRDRAVQLIHKQNASKRAAAKDLGISVWKLNRILHA